MEQVLNTAFAYGKAFHPGFAQFDHYHIGSGIYGQRIGQKLTIGSCHTRGNITSFGLSFKTSSSYVGSDGVVFIYLKSKQGFTAGTVKPLREGTDCETNSSETIAEECLGAIIIKDREIYGLHFNPNFNREIRDRSGKKYSPEEIETLLLSKRSEDHLLLNSLIAVEPEISKNESIPTGRQTQIIQYLYDLFSIEINKPHPDKVTLQKLNAILYVISFCTQGIGDLDYEKFLIGDKINLNGLLEILLKKINLEVLTFRELLNILRQPLVLINRAILDKFITDALRMVIYPNNSFYNLFLIIKTLGGLNVFNPEELKDMVIIALGKCENVKYFSGLDSLIETLGGLNVFNPEELRAIIINNLEGCISGQSLNAWSRLVKTLGGLNVFNPEELKDMLISALGKCENGENFSNLNSLIGTLSKLNVFNPKQLKDMVISALGKCENGENFSNLNSLIGTLSKLNVFNPKQLKDMVISALGKCENGENFFGLDRLIETLSKLNVFNPKQLKDMVIIVLGKCENGENFFGLDRLIETLSKLNVFNPEELKDMLISVLGKCENVKNFFGLDRLIETLSKLNVFNPEELKDMLISVLGKCENVKNFSNLNSLIGTLSKLNVFNPEELRAIIINNLEGCISGQSLNAWSRLVKTLGGLNVFNPEELKDMLISVLGKCENVEDFSGLDSLVKTLGGLNVFNPKQLKDMVISALGKCENVKNFFGLDRLIKTLGGLNVFNPEELKDMLISVLGKCENVEDFSGLDSLVKTLGGLNVFNPEELKDMLISAVYKRIIPIKLFNLDESHLKELKSLIVGFKLTDDWQYIAVIKRCIFDIINEIKTIRELVSFVQQSYSINSTNNALFNDELFKYTFDVFKHLLYNLPRDFDVISALDALKNIPMAINYLYGPENGIYKIIEGFQLPDLDIFLNFITQSEEGRAWLSREENATLLYNKFYPNFNNPEAAFQLSQKLSMSPLQGAIYFINCIQATDDGQRTLYDEKGIFRIIDTFQLNEKTIWDKISLFQFLQVLQKTEKGVEWLYDNKNPNILEICEKLNVFFTFKGAFEDLLLFLSATLQTENGQRWLFSKETKGLIKIVHPNVLGIKGLENFPLLVDAIADSSQEGANWAGDKNNILELASALGIPSSYGVVQTILRHIDFFNILEFGRKEADFDEPRKLPPASSAATEASQPIKPEFVQAIFDDIHYGEYLQAVAKPIPCQPDSHFWEEYEMDRAAEQELIIV